MTLCINFASPWTIAIITGIVLMFIASAWNFAKILFAKQIIKNDFFNMRSEMKLHREKYEREVSQIKENNNKAFQTLFDAYNKEINKLITKHVDLLNYSLTTNDKIDKNS